MPQYYRLNTYKYIYCILLNYPLLTEENYLDAIIKTVNLRKAYRIGQEKVVALDCINLEIPKGQVCCILGTSGSGKSTLLNQLAGLEKPTRGEVFIKDNKISSMNEKALATFRQKNIGFVFQSYNLLPGLTAIDNVAMPLTFRGFPKKVRVKAAREMLKRVGLGKRLRHTPSEMSGGQQQRVGIARAFVAKPDVVFADEPAREMLKRVGLGKRLRHTPSEMSGGQQQRVGIARAFVAKPDVVFADEPTGNLDTRTTREIMDLFMEFSRTYGITIVLVSHDNNLSLYADRIVTLVDGEIISDKINRSLYDVTADLRELLSPVLQERDYNTLYDLMLKYSSDYTEGVCIQALEQSFVGIENPREFIDKLLELAQTDMERVFFTKLGKESGAVPKDTDSRRTSSGMIKINKGKGPSIWRLLFGRRPKR